MDDFDFFSIGDDGYNNEKDDAAEWWRSFSSSFNSLTPNFDNNENVHPLKFDINERLNQFDFSIFQDFHAFDILSQKKMLKKFLLYHALAEKMMITMNKRIGELKQQLKYGEIKNELEQFIYAFNHLTSKSEQKIRLVKEIQQYKSNQKD